VPLSLNRGKVAVAEPVAAVEGVRVTFARCAETPEGLTNSASSELTPARLSVAAKLIVTSACDAVVLIEAGAKLSEVRAGGVVSAVDDTVILTGKPAATTSAAPII